MLLSYRRYHPHSIATQSWGRRNWPICARPLARTARASATRNRRSVRSHSATLVAQRDGRWSRPSREIRPIGADICAWRIQTSGGQIGTLCEPPSTAERWCLSNVGAVFPV